ncbi:CRE-GLR-8 protein [Aphelenchoides avenae]|nr:CRE-GLR-8 protein [Aphelenchus avenae]
MPIRDLEGLKNRRLNVVVPRIEPPYVNYLYFTDHFEDELGYTPGIVWEILRDVGRSLNLTYHIDYLPKEEWGVYINGNWTGAFGRLVRGEADIIAGAAIMDFDRALVADLTYPLDYQASGFLLRKPEQYVDYTWAVITESFSWKVTIEQMVKAIRTQKYTLLVDATATTRTQMIKHSQLKPLQDLWFEMSVNHRVKYVDDLQQGIELVKKEPGYVLMGPMETLRLLATTECDAVVLKEGVLPTYLAIPIRKGSEYVHYISERVRKFVEQGFVDRWLREYNAHAAASNGARCNVSSAFLNEPGLLELKHLQGAFWFLTLGITTSLAVFLVEQVVPSLLAHYRKRKARDEKSPSVILAWN